jgi:hypothetical protein
VVDVDAVVADQQLTADQLIAQQREDRRTAVVVREPRKKTVHAPRRGVAGGCSSTTVR